MLFESFYYSDMIYGTTVKYVVTICLTPIGTLCFHGIIYYFTMNNPGDAIKNILNDRSPLKIRSHYFASLYSLFGYKLQQRDMSDYSNK